MSVKRDYNTFYECQQLKRWHILLTSVPVNLLLVVSCIMQIGLGKPWGGNPVPDVILIVVTVLMILIMATMFWLNMKTVIDKDGIHISMRFCPFYVKSSSFLWEEVSEISVRKYSPFRAFGGWGIRIGVSSLSLSGAKMRIIPGRGYILGFNSVAYSVSGNAGMQFVYKGNKNVLIGTNSPEDLSEVLRKLGKSESNKE